MTDVRDLLRYAAALDAAKFTRTAEEAREAARALDPDRITTHTGPAAATVRFTVDAPPPAPPRRRDVMAAALARRDRDRPDWIAVGICQQCGGPVLLAPAAGVAGCPCEAVVIPRRFLRPDGGHPQGPQTFPGAEWYGPEQLPASPSASTLPMTMEEIERARQREARPFGFTRALEDSGEQ